MQWLHQVDNTGEAIAVSLNLNTYFDFIISECTMKCQHQEAPSTINEFKKNIAGFTLFECMPPLVTSLFFELLRYLKYCGVLSFSDNKIIEKIN